MSEQAPPTTKRDAAFRILFAEVNDLFAKVESLTGAVEAVDTSAKQTARHIQETLRAAKQIAASLPDKPIPMIEPKRPNPLVVAICSAVVAGVVTGAIVVACSAWLNGSRDEARLGRAVTAAFPSLDASTREKLQAAINNAQR